MGTRNEAVFQDLRKRIEEENSIPRKRKHFSKETKNEVARLMSEGYKASVLCQRLGISESNLGKWKRRAKSSVPQPKKLKIVSNFEEVIAVEQPFIQSEKIEVQLPNGVTLKNLSLDAATLALLRRC